MENLSELIPTILSCIVFLLCTVALLIILRDMTRSRSVQLNLRKLEKLLESPAVAVVELSKNKVKNEFFISVVYEGGRRVSSTWDNPAEFDIAVDNLTHNN